MRIFLVRHGESLGDVDYKNYEKIDDHNIPLSQWGYEQAMAAGSQIKAYYDAHPECANNQLKIYHSPFLRAKQTMEGITHTLGSSKVKDVKESFLLKEQDWGMFNNIWDFKDQERLFPLEKERFDKQRKHDGAFYAKPPSGESRADVAHRALSFKTNHIDSANLAENEDILVVGHGVLNRAMEMVIADKNIDWFEKEPNPGNTDITLLEGSPEKGFTAKVLYKGKTRPEMLPKDYKTAPHGEVKLDDISR